MQNCQKRDTLCDLHWMSANNNTLTRIVSCTWLETIRTFWWTCLLAVIIDLIFLLKREREKNHSFHQSNYSEVVILWNYNVLWVISLISWAKQSTDWFYVPFHNCIVHIIQSYSPLLSKVVLMTWLTKLVFSHLALSKKAILFLTGKRDQNREFCFKLLNWLCLQSFCTSNE